MISERSSKHIQTKMFILNCISISQYYCFYCIFDQINAALVSIRDYLKKKHLQKSYWLQILNASVHTTF